ncbi:hypothetical protein BDBG_02152 [Blastomyces gilchristii SLH14081]|uniref:Uncharacterized protein n=1 Tax=Blastomyces gilchristii (strain SLH14081) TaxID=559298 RepID=A0A179UCU8_BLAGS|nr:uncharacterized protein BDBG_02152 [Blastomyces gilchristii SLH14081]OAT05825.1 hypothetical protein BDBG_02152 [Blastomyces gilchristii SLH14081]
MTDQCRGVDGVVESNELSVILRIASGSTAMHHRFMIVLSISSRELEKKNKREEAKQPAMLPKDENAVTVRCINKRGQSAGPDQNCHYIMYLLSKE